MEEYLIRTHGKDNVFRQVSIRPYDSTGKPVNYLVRADFVVITPEGKIALIVEAKASARGSLISFTKNQKKGYPLIEANGGEIIGTGMQNQRISPVPVKIKRPEELL